MLRDYRLANAQVVSSVANQLVDQQMMVTSLTPEKRAGLLWTKRRLADIEKELLRLEEHGGR